MSENEYQSEYGGCISEKGELDLVMHRCNHRLEDVLTNQGSRIWRSEDCRVIYLIIYI